MQKIIFLLSTACYLPSSGASSKHIMATTYPQVVYCCVRLYSCWRYVYIFPIEYGHVRTIVMSLVRWEEPCILFEVQGMCLYALTTCGLCAWSLPLCKVHPLLPALYTYMYSTCTWDHPCRYFRYDGTGSNLLLAILLLGPLGGPPIQLSQAIF